MVVGALSIGTGMDGTREQPPRRSAEQLGPRSGVRVGAGASPWRNPALQPAFAAAAARPAAAPDVLIDFSPRPEPPAMPAPEPVPAEPAAKLAKPPSQPPRKRAQRVRHRRNLPILPVALGAAAAVALVATTVLLRQNAQSDPAPMAATLLAVPEVAAEPSAAPAATIHLRVGQELPAAERQRIEAALAKAGYGRVVVHELPFAVSRSRVGYFHEADRPSAEALVKALRGTEDGIELRDYRTLMAAPEPGRLDLWIGS